VYAESLVEGVWRECHFRLNVLEPDPELQTLLKATEPLCIVSGQAVFTTDNGSLHDVATMLAGLGCSTAADLQGCLGNV
jgi:hypothetical protein